uniref:C2H2-type domain-containing protein n=1 Tax=Oncorhynchus mykiss TaxID=8022 RepID=A0A8C7TYH3_ONCMY
MSKKMTLGAFINSLRLSTPISEHPRLSVLETTNFTAKTVILNLYFRPFCIQFVLILLFHPFFPPDLQQFTLPEEEVNYGQQHCEQEWSANLGPVESDAVESIWDSINIITVENQTESEDESNRESQSTSDYQGRPRKHTGESPDLKCDVCGKFLATAANLKRHQQNHHREERPRKETSGLPDLKCEVCGKCFTAARSLMRHRRNRHSDERPYMCDTCGQCFTLNCYLTRHMKRHTEERQHSWGDFKCDVCGRCLTTKGGLKFHQKKHTEQKTHRCKECSKAFFSSSLKRHLRTHRKNIHND